MNYREHQQQQQLLLDSLYDKWRAQGANIGAIGEITRHSTKFDDKYGDHGETLVTFALPRGVTKEEALAYARSTYNSHCQHEYDCCGNVYGNVISGSLQRDHQASRGRDNSSVWTIIYTWHRNV